MSTESVGVAEGQECFATEQLILLLGSASEGEDLSAAIDTLMISARHVPVHPCSKVVR